MKKGGSDLTDPPLKCYISLFALLDRNVHHWCWRNDWVRLGTTGSTKCDTGGGCEDNGDFHNCYYLLLVGDFRANYLENSTGAGVGTGSG